MLRKNLMITYSVFSEVSKRELILQLPTCTKRNPVRFGSQVMTSGACSKQSEISV